MRKNNGNTAGFLALLLVLFATPCAGQDEGCAAWSEQEGNSANIYLAELQNGVWGKSRKITDQSGINITPTVSMAANGDIWLVWVDIANGARILRYFSQQPGGEKRGEVSSVGGKPSFSPSIAIDRRNTPWLAWAMDDGTDEDIYFSRWNGSGWQTPERVHADNSYPDITPTIGIGTNGQPWISWESFDGKGYVTLTVNRRGESWQPSAKGAKALTFRSRIERQKSHLPDLPNAAEDRLMGSVFIRGGGEIQSMSERIFKFKPRKVR